MARRTNPPQSERRRVLASLGAGVVAGVLALGAHVWELSILIGWNVTATAFMASTWRSLLHADAESTRIYSTREDDSRASARTLTVAAATSSLVAVLFGLARASGASTRLEIGLTVVSLFAVVESWLVIQTVFALRYAHLHYSGSAGGIVFPGDGDPDYQDFAYVAFTVGMTYQVADTDIASRDIRRTLLLHSLLSYVYGAVIIAVAINLTAGFIGA